MRIKATILKTTMFALGILCLVAFFMAHRNNVPPRWIHPDAKLYGKMNFVKHFMVELPPELPPYRTSTRNPDPADADILTFGDSFFDFSRQMTFPERLGEALDLKVFYARRTSPLSALADLRYQPTSKRKLAIVEVVERSIPSRFSAKHEIDNWTRRTGSRAKHIIEAVFPPRKDEMYGFLLERGRFTHKPYSELVTWKFDHFGFLTSNTPVYSLDPPFLFYHQTVNDQPTSYYYQHSAKELNTYCDNIADLAGKLETLFNLEMVFMPVPNKYTVYSKVVNSDPYNGFLPKLYACLDASDVPVVKLYEPYMASNEWLYYGTDTH